MKTIRLLQTPHARFNSIISHPFGLVILFICFIGFGAYQAKAQNTQTFNSSDSFQVPANISKITVEAWGGGGAGGGSTNAGGTFTARGGAGGGGGAYASTTIDVTPGSTISIVVAGQASGVSGGTGNDGGHSTVTGFEAEIFAAGGKGGAGNTSGGDPAGGAGGSVIDSEGTTVIAGQNGGDGDTGASIESGAGGDAANGGGVGGAAVGGSFISADGNPGDVPGGGGSGSRTSGNNGNRTGGLGAAGRVVVSWINCPAIAASGTWNDATCFETNDGSITITASGGTGPYMYSIDNGQNFDASNVFNNLPPGEYRIRVKDLSTGCLSPEIP